MREVDCKAFLECLYLLMDGELPPPRCDDLTAHMERCRECLERHDLELAFKRFVARTCCAAPAPEPLMGRLRAAIRAEVEAAGGPGAGSPA